MIPALTPGLIFIDIVVFCVIIPVVAIFRDEQHYFAPVRLRRKAAVLMALISGVPVMAVYFWDHLGVPPDANGWTAILLDCVAHITVIILVPVLLCVERSRPVGVVLAVLGFALFVMTQLVGPPAATLIEIYSTKASMAGRPLTASPCDDLNVQPIFAHISDLHITEKATTRDGKLPGNNKLEPLFRRLNKYNPPYLIVSGDITDEGTATQWRLVERLVNPLLSDTKIFISTGNHDLNYFFGRDPEEHPWTWFGLRSSVGLDAEPRIFRAAEFQARHLPDVRGSSGGRLKDTTTNVPTSSNLNHFPAQIAECKMSCISNSELDPAQGKLEAAACRSLCATNVESIRFHYFNDLSESFPSYFVDEASQTAFISLTTSMADSAEVGRNAIGLTGKDQIKNLKAELSGLPASVKYIVLVQHHPLLWNGVPPFPRVHWADFFHPRKTIDYFYTSPWFLAVFLHNDIAEGEQIYALIKDELARRPGTSVLVAFGHRHLRSLTQDGSIIFEEAPNLATENADNYGFYLVGTKAGALNVSWCAVAEK
jgi:3',5'-cyclic AMP phosphodiesterase CpdA